MKASKNLLVSFLTVSFILSGCSNSAKPEETAEENTEVSAETEKTEENAEEKENTEENTDNTIITFDNITVAENDYVAIELVNFFEKPTNWVEGERNEKCVTFKVKNKSDREMLIFFHEAYLGDDDLHVIMQGGNKGPKPGKTGTYAYYLDYNTAPNPTEIESLDMLKQLEGRFEIDVYDESGEFIEEYQNIEFDLKNVLN